VWQSGTFGAVHLPMHYLQLLPEFHPFVSGVFDYLVLHEVLVGQGPSTFPPVPLYGNTHPPITHSHEQDVNCKVLRHFSESVSHLSNRINSLREPD